MRQLETDSGLSKKSRDAPGDEVRRELQRQSVGKTMHRLVTTVARGELRVLFLLEAVTVGCNLTRRGRREPRQSSPEVSREGRFATSAAQ